MIQLHLSPSHGPVWHGDTDERLFVRGHCFDAAGQYFEGVDLLQFFGGISSEAGWLRRLQEANGSFSVIRRERETTYAAVDSIASLPLRYAVGANSWHLGAEMADFPGPFQTDSTQVQLFPFACHTLGVHSLWEEGKQLQAGEWVAFTEESATHHTYGAPFQQVVKSDPALAQPEAFQQVALETFERLLKSTEGKPLLVPLSGGFDSRFIVAMLKKLGREDVTCFTYGRPSSFEVEISRKVAQQLDFPWHMVPYEEELLSLYQQDIGLRYQTYASNGGSLAHEQDFFAIHQLLAEGKISPDSVVLPGFGADVLAGSWFPTSPPKQWNRSTFLRYVLRNPKFFSGTRSPRLPEQIQELIWEEIPTEGVSDLSTAYRCLQYWGLRNRMSKFLVNAVRVYDFFELEWRLPFFDQAWVKYWEALPLPHKPQKNWYLQNLNEWLFEPMGIDFTPPVPPPSPWKDALKYVIPDPLIDLVKNAFVMREAFDVNNQDSLSRLICVEQGWDEKLMRTYDLNYLMAKAFLGRIL